MQLVFQINQDREGVEWMQKYLKNSKNHTKNKQKTHTNPENVYETCTEQKTTEFTFRCINILIPKIIKFIFIDYIYFH